VSGVDPRERWLFCQRHGGWWKGVYAADSFIATCPACREKKKQRSAPPKSSWLMQITPGKFKTMKEEIDRPIPHYPNWAYWCPLHNGSWESELYREAYVVPCPDCLSKEEG